MNRTTATVLAVGSALTLAACSSHSSGAIPPVTTPSATSQPAAPTGSPAAGTPPASQGAPSSAPAAASPVSATTGASTSASSTAATSVSPTATKPAGPSRCLTSHLTVTLKAGSPGAGQIYTEIVFTNSGAAACTLYGHPGVSYVAGDDGHQVGASAARNTGTLATVHLAAGGTASALLHETNYQNFDAAVCQPVEVRGLRIYPPGSKASVFIKRAGKQCSSTSLPSTALSIGVVKAGTGD